MAAIADWPAGAVLVALINFLVIAFVVFLIVRAIEGLRRAEEAVAPPDPQAGGLGGHPPGRCPRPAPALTSQTRPNESALNVGRAWILAAHPSHRRQFRDRFGCRFPAAAGRPPAHPSCRNPATSAALRERLGGAVLTPICDLLKAGQPIDTLVLNAGLQYSGAREPRWSAQGFELTGAVNHLAHLALLQRLLPLLLLLAKAARLVVTTSEVHDPATAGPRRPDARWPQPVPCGKGLQGQQALQPAAGP